MRRASQRGRRYGGFALGFACFGHRIVLHEIGFIEKKGAVQWKAGEDQCSLAEKKYSNLPKFEITRL